LDRVLIYATGGVAFTNVSVGTNFVFFRGAIATSATDNETLAGGTLGGGVEYAITNRWSVGVEGR